MHNCREMALHTRTCVRTEEERGRAEFHNLRDETLCASAAVYTQRLL